MIEASMLLFRIFMCDFIEMLIAGMLLYMSLKCYYFNIMYSSWVYALNLPHQSHGPDGIPIHEFKECSALSSLSDI